MIWAGVHRSWRVSLSVALGVAVAAAVIVGALLVGDSMRGSLRSLTLERLGKTESAIIPGAFFSAEGIIPTGSPAIPLILFDRGIAETRGDDGQLRRAGSVQIIGCDDRFWTLAASGRDKPPAIDDQSIVLNQRAAIELGVQVGDRVTLRLPVEQAVPADSPLGRRDTESQSLPRMKVAGILPDKGLGRFSLAASQASPMNVYVNRSVIGKALDRSGQANVLLLDRRITADDLTLDLADFGLNLRRIQQVFAEGESSEIVYDYYSLTSDRLLLPDPAVQVIREQFSDSQISEVTTYLANAIERLDEDGTVLATVPYSTITAIDSTDSLPLDFDRPDGITGDIVPLVLNSWAAKRLDAGVGTMLRVAYYEPEVENGNEIERTFDAVVSEIVPITQPSSPYRRDQPASFDQRPTVYNDSNLTPIVPGVTDQDSINDWDLPFQLKREISKEDDLYWNDYRLTPKAFLPLADGKRLFGSRFGATTGIRFSSDVAPDLQSLHRQLDKALTPIQAELGWAIHPIRETQLAASSGTTPFDGLFLALSFFVILAAMLLIAMLFRLGLIARTKQFGTLLAVGWPPGRVSRLALGEGLMIAVVGVLIGIVLGIGYAWFVLWALRSWWVGAVTVPFLTFHWTWRSLIVGAVVGWLVAAVTLLVAVRWLTRTTAIQLLSGKDPDAASNRFVDNRRSPKFAIGIGLLGIAIAFYGATLAGQAAAGAFVGGGTMLLVAALMLIHWRLGQRRPLVHSGSYGDFTIATLASLSASRHPLRSTMTIGLMASAAFLIIAIAAFRLSPSEAGTGGFTLIGQSAQPILRDLRDRQVQSELIGTEAESLAKTTIVPIRLRLGQDASCNNLYQATQPTVLGLPETFSDVFGPQKLAGFETIGADNQVWDLLAKSASGSETDPIPMVIDQNTAMWSLQMMQGVGERKSFEYQSGRPVWFQVVGLLSNSMLQGKLLIGESNFERQFPSVNGYRYFLFADQQQKSAEIASVLEDRLGDFGMDVSRSDEVLSGLMAVQNTYLRTFQSLGGLGLLLGTIGLAVSQMRSVLQRRNELGVLQAMGFTQRRLAGIVMRETASLLVMGVGCGTLCAAIVVIPHAMLSGLQPPILEPIVLVIAIIAFGLIAGLIVVRQVVAMPLLESLRSE